MKKSKKRCAQCGWLEENHQYDFCYDYSDQDTDYFSKELKFISEESLKGKKYSKAFNGKIIIH